MFPQNAQNQGLNQTPTQNPQTFLPATPAPVESNQTPLVQEKTLQNPQESSPQSPLQSGEWNPNSLNPNSPNQDGLNNGNPSQEAWNGLNQESGSQINLQTNSQSNPQTNPPILEDSQGSLVAKNVYLSLVSPLQNVLYVKQIVPIEVKLLVFGAYSSIKTNFIASDSSVSVLNPQESWILNQDSSLRNTFYFRINQANFTIPRIEVVVQTSEGEARESIEPISSKAVALERKGSYSQVVAEDLRIIDTKITSYDSESNLAVLQMQSEMGNLFDFHLDSYAQQGIESKKGDYKQSEIFYYVVVPKSLDKISFDYFNTQSAKYVELQVENFSQDDRISTQSDIKPKNTLQIYKILAAIFLIIVFFGLYLYRRKKLFLILGIVVVVVLVYLLSIKTSAILKPNIEVRIQPTFNSTIILTTQNPVEVKILAHKHGYYKVLLEDERIGWVREDGIQN